MQLWTALMLGFAGSLHCAAMCGPLVLAMPVPPGRLRAHITGKLAYNAGRIVTYGLLGMAFGLSGQWISLAGFQRWVSILAGVAILIGMFGWPRRHATLLISRPLGALKSALGSRLQRHGWTAQFTFGLLNGLLPCGLVYVACAAAAATASLAGGLHYMVLFGVGTVPMMLGLGLAGRALQFKLQFRLRKLIPVSMATMAVLLLLRGLDLGIPYLSPHPNSTDPAKSSCCEVTPEAAPSPSAQR
jgi:sulfite exporter TauE/SafE